MQIFLLILGLILLSIGGFLFYRRSQLQDHILAIKTTDTSTVQELQELQRTIVDELGTPGAFRQQVELKGTIRCNNPLTANLSNKKCVYYQTKITEKYEETEYETDEDGNQERTTTQSTRTINNSTTQINFWLEDKTGRITINPNDAEIDAIKIVDRFEPANPGGISLSLGGMNLDLSGRFDDDYRTIGYNYEEQILPIDSPVYVLGEVSDTDNQLTIKSPSELGQPFIISHQSEEDLVKAKTGSLKNTTIGGAICLLIGGVLFVFSILNLL